MPHLRLKAIKTFAVSSATININEMINLEKILNKCCKSKTHLPGYELTISNATDAMREAIRQALELAAEKADVDVKIRYEEENWFVDKKSITDVINLIK